MGNGIPYCPDKEKFQPFVSVKVGDGAPAVVLLPVSVKSVGAPHGGLLRKERDLFLRADGCFGPSCGTDGKYCGGQDQGFGMFEFHDGIRLLVSADLLVTKSLYQNHGRNTI